MESEITNEKAQTQLPTGDTTTGSQSETTGLVDRAITAAERLEKATANLKAENDRAESLYARQKLAGHSFAGQAVKTPEQVLEEKDRAEADAALRAYGFKK